jgi:hypothetical protein
MGRDGTQSFFQEGGMPPYHSAAEAQMLETSLGESSKWILARFASVPMRPSFRVR